MNLILRSITIQFFIIAQIVLFILWSTAVFFMVLDLGLIAFYENLSRPLWIHLVSGSIILLSTLLMNLTIRKAYRKAGTASLFFLSMFIFCLSWEVLTVLQFWLGTPTVSYFWGILLTRMVWAFRFAGLFALVASGLPSVGFQYQGYGTMVSICTVLALALAVSMPLDTSILKPDLLYRLADDSAVDFVSVALGLLVLVSHLLGVWVKRSKEYWLLTLGCFFILLGWQGILAHLPGAILVIVPGVVLFSRQSVKIYGNI